MLLQKFFVSKNSPTKFYTFLFSKNGKWLVENGTECAQTFIELLSDFSNDELIYQKN